MVVNHGDIHLLDRMTAYIAVHTLLNDDCIANIGENKEI